MLIQIISNTTYNNNNNHKDDLADPAEGRRLGHELERVRGEARVERPSAALRADARRAITSAGGPEFFFYLYMIVLSIGHQG